MHFLSKLFIKFTAKYVGKDQFGNKYFEKPAQSSNHFNRPERFVIYKGDVEGSKVPPQWFAWLHHQVEKKPSNKLLYDWQRDYQVNSTGTAFAYYPPGHINAKGARKKATGDYQAWTPGGTNDEN